MKQTILNAARSDKFTLTMDLPIALKKYFKTNLQDISADSVQFTTFGSPVPAIDIPAIKLPYSGQNMNISSGARSDYGPLSLKVLLDNTYQNYWILWNWLNLFNDSYDSSSQINDPLSTLSDLVYVSQNPFSEYVTDFTLTSLDEYNQPVIKFKYAGCFITSLSEILYSHQDETSITCNAKFSYNQMLLEKVNNS